jgi:hypothetical protein
MTDDANLYDRIIAAESGGNPYAKNPNSSAGGLGQFIDSTWLDTVKRNRPDIAHGRSDQEILALKSNPQLSRDMTAAYANQNVDYLRSRGFDASPGNTYLAHFAGPGGAATVLAHPDAPVTALLAPSAIQANPFLRNMTGADLMRWASTRVGGQESPSAQPAAPALSAQTASPAPQMDQANVLRAFLALSGGMQQQPTQLKRFPNGSIDYSGTSSSNVQNMLQTMMQGRQAQNMINLLTPQPQQQANS